MAEMSVIAIAFGLMLIVVIPVVVMALWFPHRYSASRPKGDYDPKWSYSRRLDLIIWLVPAAIVTILGTLAWSKTHELDPSRALASDEKGLHVQAVALDWKWLFIYPDQHVAAVNRLVVPAGAPVNLTLTSDTVITSFFIPRLGSQIYAMAGRKSHLHLLANEQGTYFGQNQQFSGSGYADMRFKVRVTSGAGFHAWVRGTRRSAPKLDEAAFSGLRRPGVGAAGRAFSRVAPGFFDEVVRHYRPARRVPGDKAQEEGS